MKKAELFKYISECDANYHSFRANKCSMNFSQFKEFLPELGGCEARAFAKYVTATYKDPASPVMTLSNLGHQICLSPELLEQFKIDNVDILMLAQKYETVDVLDDKGKVVMTVIKEGSKAKLKPITEKKPLIREYNQDARNVVKAADGIQAAEYFKYYMKGSKEKPAVFEIDGYLARCKFDNQGYDNGHFFTDLKFMGSFKDEYNKFHKKFVPWWKHWFYDLQMGFYSGAYLEETGHFPDFAAIIGASKVKLGPPDYKLLKFLPNQLEIAYEAIVEWMPQVMEVKSGEREAIRCGNIGKRECFYCRSTSLANIKEQVIG